MGMGISGGEEGAREGPSLMPGSKRKALMMGHVQVILVRLGRGIMLRWYIMGLIMVICS